MPAQRTATALLEQRLQAELELIRSSVNGVHGSLVATTDGFLVAHDVPDFEPTEIAALVATTRALASRSTHATGCGDFRETVARGSSGYLAVYAAGANAIVGVIGSSDLNVGMLHFQARQIIERIAAEAPELRRWTAGGRQPVPVPPAPGSPPPPLPRRRPAGRG
jgi:uncharacterized protein